MQTKINWFGLAGGITVISLIIISMSIPWWQLKVGDELVKANASPLNTNFNFIGDELKIPLLTALNLSSIISLTAGGVAILIYSLKPEKTYSESLLNFSYRKPLYSLLLFIIGLFTINLILKSMFNLSIPLIGSIRTTLPTNMTSGLIISVLMSAEFIWPFWLATAAAGLCIAAKIYHKKLAKT